MKIIPSLFTLIAGGLWAVAEPVLAVHHQPEVIDCSVIKIGPEWWRAKFTYSIKEDPYASPFRNTFNLFLPKLNSAGKPDPVNTLVIVYSNLQFSMPSIVLGPSYPTQLIFRGYPDAEIIKQTSTVSIDFSTAGGGYPGLRLVYFWPNAQITKDITAIGCLDKDSPEIPPIDEVDPPEPEFKLKSAVWELETQDVGDLPETTVPGAGHAAIIKNAANNNLCVSYVTAGVKNKKYAISVTNGSSLLGGRELYVMNGPAGSQLPYHLRLTSNDGVTGNDFEFPSLNARYITLSQMASSTNKRSEMCWTPGINLFKTSQTKGGLHTDTVNFIITPQA